MQAFSPKVVEAQGYVIPKDSVVEHEVPAGKSKIVRAGKPKVVKINTNVHPAGVPQATTAGVPKACIPGKDGFSLPKTVPAIDRPFIAGIPKVIMAKEAYTKEQNPENFSFFGKSHGLKSNAITCLLEDNSGNLWFGTQAGVSKYDGKNFTHFTQKEGLVSNAVTSMLQDKNGNLWFGKINTGLSKYDGRCFSNFTVKEGLSSNRVLSMLKDKNGNLWFGTEAGVNKYDGKSFTHFTQKEGLINNTVLSILEDKNGKVWFGTYGGVSKYDGKSFRNFTVKEGLGANRVNCILEDKSGHLWFGTEQGGVDKYDGKSFIHFTDKEGLKNNTVRSILKDKSGNLWFGTRGGGAIKFDGKSFTNFTDKEGLSDNNVLSILEDKSGSLWFGTYSGGVNKYAGKSFTHFNVKDGLTHNNIRSVMEDKQGNLWVGTNGGGVNKYDGKSFTHFTEREGLSNNVVTSIMEDKHGNVWFSTEGAVCAYDGKSFTHFTEKEGLDIDDVTSSLADKNGNLWFGTWAGGVNKYDGKRFTNFTWSDRFNNMRLLEDKSGNFWFGSASGNGVIRYDGERFTLFTEKNGLSNNFVRSILEDKSGNLWFATLNGVSKYDGKSFTNFTEKDGLSNNDVWSIIEDKNDNLWFGTAVGLAMLQEDKLSTLTGTATYEAASGLLFKTYTYEDGFSGIGVFGSQTICEAADGTIWIGTHDRLTAFHPGKKTLDTAAPNIQLTGLTLYNEIIPWQNLISSSGGSCSGREINDTIILLGNGVRVHDFHFGGVSKWYGVPENLSLPYDNNYLTFQFVGITMQSPKKVKYKYKLEGLDKNWSALTDRTEAPYGNLPHGNYTFKVKAMNGDGYWSNEFNYSFTIRPPWWRTWWAYALFALVFAGFIYALFRYRLNRIRMQHEIVLQQHKASQLEIDNRQALLYERLRISRELHDDIGSTLGSISIYSEVAKKRTEKNENPNEVLSKIGLVSRELIDKMSDIVWSLNPNHESFEQLQNRMMTFAGMILAPRNIRYDFIAEERLKEIQFTAEQRKNIFLIFKEALYNIVKYAHCKTTDISLCVQNNDFIMMIQDDGKGFDVSHTNTNEILSAGQYLGGNGIKNMKARAEDMDAKLRISSEINKGTSVQLNLHL